MPQPNVLFGCDLTNGSPGPACIIAEAGINHDGSMEKARALIRVAAEANCSCVKFQAFKTEKVSSLGSLSSSYMEEGSHAGETAYDLSRRLELTTSQLGQLCRYAGEAGIPWIASFFDEDSLALLVSLRVPVLKVASGLITDFPLLEKAASANIPLIVSTGMASLDEIDAAVSLLRAVGAPAIYLMHCVSWYPAAVEDMNIRVIDTLAARYRLPVGLSDHTLGSCVAWAARARGAKLFEKHFTLSANAFGPDHAASLEPKQLKEMVAGVQAVGRCLGTGVKVVGPVELDQRRVFRKSVVAACFIPRGTIITREQLAAKRPGFGIPPSRLEEVIGCRARGDIDADAVIDWPMLHCPRTEGP